MNLALTLLFLAQLGGGQPLGLPFGADSARVKAALAAAGISCKVAADGIWECPRAPAKVAGSRALRLNFDKDRLVRADLEIDPGAQTFAVFRSRYVELKRELTEKYGEPKTSLEYVDRFYVLADDELRAIAEGKGEFTSTWKKGELDAMVSLRGENRQLRLSLVYVLRPSVLH